jgi:hypothetical protein
MAEIDGVSVGRDLISRVTDARLHRKRDTLLSGKMGVAVASMDTVGLWLTARRLSSLPGLRWVCPW